METFFLIHLVILPLYAWMPGTHVWNSKYMEGVVCPLLPYETRVQIQAIRLDSKCLYSLRRRETPASASPRVSNTGTDDHDCAFLGINLEVGG